MMDSCLFCTFGPGNPSRPDKPWPPGKPRGPSKPLKPGPPLSPGSPLGAETEERGFCQFTGFLMLYSKYFWCYIHSTKCCIVNIFDVIYTVLNVV